MNLNNSKFIFILQKVVLLLPLFHQWHDKQTDIMFHTTNFILSDRIYPIECTILRIEGILWHILWAAKDRAIW